MTARILVVDDVDTNIRLLQAKLSAEYFDVITATDGETALLKAVSEQPDLILLDVMMPGLDGFEVCRRLKVGSATRHIPVVMVTALDGREDRIRGLEAGADDFLAKPLDDLMLFARVRSLTQLKASIEELRKREESGRRMGLLEGSAFRQKSSGGRVLVVDDQTRQAEKIAAELSSDHRVTVMDDPERALTAARGPVDLIIINGVSETFDGLKLIAQIRSNAISRAAPVLAIVDVHERPRVVKALELGANDILARPIDPQELAARCRTLMRHKRYADSLRNKLDHSLEMAVTDPLTGLHNRRYLLGQLDPLVDHAGRGGTPASVLILDIDHFKSINDSFGHDAGDEVLVEFAVRLATNVRAVDLPCRYGGEEFVVIMPETRVEDAKIIADRIRAQVAGTPFMVMEGRESLNVTISIGVAATTGEGDSVEAVLKRADEALYEAKQGGRNRVIARAA
ncbi:MAG: PleD family two-component system response regulator [Caulobacterales bacterium]|nr:PleD family two-component system response regulator [Caulobacterales bacterium]